MTKHQQNKLEKATTKIAKKTDEDIGKGKVAAIVMLIIMVFSVVGFMLSGVDFSQDQQNPENIPFQQFTYDGQTFWGAVVNKEQFVFPSIEGFEQREDLNQIAQVIKSNNQIYYYLDENYEDLNGVFVLEQKLATAYNLQVSPIQNQSLLSCSSQTTIIFTNNENSTFDQTCNVMYSAKGEESNDALILTYHIVKSN